MGLSPVPTPAVLDALRAATLSDDGLTLTLNGQLDADTYRRVKKTLDGYGGKWNRRSGTHDFTKDFRPHLEHLLAGGKVGADNGGKNPLAFFATPEPVVLEMCKRIWPWAPDARFLEPSAGTGAIARFLRDRHQTTADCVELDEDRYAQLVASGFNVVGRDFLQFNPEQPYDYVLMNPPFTAPGDAQAYITHIEHALKCLCPGGDLVAIVPQGYAHGSQKRVAAFREYCQAHAQSPVHTFAPGTFKASGTEIVTCLIHLTKPEAEEAVMTQPAEQPALKTTRKSKKAEAPADNVVDFKQLAAETRAKMQASAEKGRTKAVRKAKDPSPAPSEDLPFPVTDTQLEDAIRAKAADIQGPEGGFVYVPSEPRDEGEDESNPAQVQELPGTPALSSAGMEKGALGLFAVPLWQTERSSCNVRHHYDPTAIEELAASLKAEGQIENATGRWSADGKVEVVAGESRRRAQLLREEQGEMGLTLLVNIRELTDAEALSISATENMRRRNMTALEECEAMQRLNDAGRSVEEIQAMFGYRTAQPVADRILVAKNLHTKGRDALESGQISLAQAMVIARAPGEQLQKEMLNWAAMGHSADRLAKRLVEGQFLVEHAKFNVEKSGLSVKRDLFEAFPAYFEDKAAALEAQLKWAEARAEKARAKGKHLFVAVESGENPYRTLTAKKYELTYNTDLTGLIFFVNTATGAVTEETKYKLCGASTANPTPTPANGSTKGEGESRREFGDPIFTEAHHLRAAAAREAVLGNTHLTLALTVWGLILSQDPYVNRIQQGQMISQDPYVNRIQQGQMNGLPGTREARNLPPALSAAMDELHGLIVGTADSDHAHIHRMNSGATPKPKALLELLVAQTDEKLLGLLNTLAAASAYDWNSYYPRNSLNPEYAYIASLTDAPQRLAQSFTLTDEWLKRYPRHELVALAEEAGLGRALVEDCGTLREMRARILEHADALHREGFVPRLVQFPAPPAPAQTRAQDATPERDRATQALASIPDASLPALLDASGYDHTDWDSVAEMREWAQTQIDTIGEQDCAAWEELHAAAAAQPTGITETAAD